LKKERDAGQDLEDDKLDLQEQKALSEKKKQNHFNLN